MALPSKDVHHAPEKVQPRRLCKVAPAPLGVTKIKGEALGAPLSSILKKVLSSRDRTRSRTGILLDGSVGWFPLRQRVSYVARRLIAAWRNYNTVRPHSSLRYTQPALFEERAA